MKWQTLLRRTSLVLLILIIAILIQAANAQEFRLEQLDRIRSDFMRNGNSTPATPQAETAKKIQQDIQIKSATKLSSAAIKLPTSQEVVVKSDVAHINPDTYILGPGDQLFIIMYGMISQKIPATVQPNGTIFVEPATPIKVEGLSVTKAREKIYLTLKRYFKNFNVDIQMSALRTFQVEVLGEVASPGTYIVTPTAGVCDALGLAGGLKENASTRNITLEYKEHNIKRRIDVFAWYYQGKSSENRPLTGRCTIYVPLMKQKVIVEGAFKRTGIFEIAQHETLRDLVKMVEPETGSVLNEAKITRISTDNSLKVVPVNLNTVLENPSAPENITLADGDTLFMPDLEVFLDKITVVGEFEGANLFTKSVNRLTGQEEIIKTGLYKLRENEKVKDVVIALGGLTVQADLENSRIERPTENNGIKIIPLDLHKLMNLKDENQNLALLPGDSLIVPAKPTNIYILGEIRSPGMYKYNVGNKLKEYIALAGGPTGRARMKMTKVIQKENGKTIVRTVDLRSILTGNQEETFDLRAGDVVYIPYAQIVSWQDIVRAITDIIVLRQLFK